MTGFTSFIPCPTCDQPMRSRDLLNDDGRPFRVYDCEACRVMFNFNASRLETGAGDAPTDVDASQTSGRAVNSKPARPLSGGA